MADGTAFVGIDCNIPEILAYQQQIFSNYIVTGPLHITLKYLGLCTHAEIKQIAEFLDKVHAHSFSFVTAEVSTFRNPEKTRLMMLNVKAPKEMFVLQQKITRCLLSMFSAEDEFTPHITVARSKSAVNIKQFESMDPVRIKVEKFHLYYKQKGKYTIVKSFTLD